MGLTVKQGIRPGAPGRVLSFAEEKNLTDKINHLEDVKDEIEVQQGLNYEVKDRKALEKRLNNLKAVKETQAAQPLEGRERDLAVKEEQKLREMIRVKWGGEMPTYSQYWMKPKDGGIRYLRLVDRIVKLNKDREYAGIIQRWKNISRRLNPDDPHASNTLNLIPGA